MIDEQGVRCAEMARLPVFGNTVQVTNFIEPIAASSKELPTHWILHSSPLPADLKELWGNVVDKPTNMAIDQHA